MIEQIRAVHNPLTIIAIFAALAEIAGTVALATVDPQYQRVFIWFVMLFPTFLVAWFFLTLNFNPKVLYAPSDFRNEENFLKILSGSHKLTSSLQTIDVNVDHLRKVILAQIPKEMASMREADRNSLTHFLEQQLSSLREQIDQTRQSAETLSSDLALQAYPQSSVQARILSLLSGTVAPLDSQEIAKTFGMSQAAVVRALERLEQRGLVEACAIQGAHFSDRRLSFRLRKSTREKTQEAAASDNQ